MPWLILLAAGGCEAVWAYTLKVSDGMTRLVPAAVTVVFYVASVYLLALAMRHLPLSVSYPVWTGIGAVASALVGMLVLGEAASALKFASIALIVAGIAGLSLAGH